MLAVLSKPAEAARADAVHAYLNQTMVEPVPLHAAAAGGGVKGWLSLRAIAWYPKLRGTANEDGGGDFDLDGDLGLGDNELVFVPQLTVDFWIFGFRLDYFNVKFEGDGRVQGTFTFGDRTFDVDEATNSELELTNLRSLGTISFVNTDVVRLAFILGFNYYEYKARITGEVNGTANSNGTIPFPVVGLLLQIRIGDFLIEAEGSGFYIDYNDIEATAGDFTLSAAYRFLKVGEVRVGYRYILIDGTIDETNLDVRLDGFFIGIGVTF